LSLEKLEQNGVFSWRLGGVIYESSSMMVKASRADCLNPDGTINAHPDPRHIDDDRRESCSSATWMTAEKTRKTGSRPSQGYAATDEQWRAFESEVEQIFAAAGVRVLHAKDLHHTEGEFAGWTVLRKQAFVARICRALSRHVPLGMSMSALKETYKSRAAESGRKRTVTPYTFCSNVIIQWVLTDIRVGRIANTDGVAFVLESGNEHNAEAEQNLRKVREKHKLENIPNSMSFVSKDGCRAIQMADLFAFYSRRHGVAMEKAPLHDAQTCRRARC
jgi:hypothetical protein